MILDEKKKNALELLYQIHGIPFTILSYKGERLFVMPEELSSFYKKDIMIDPPKTLSQSENPSGITLVETGELCGLAIVKIDDESYAISESVPFSLRGSVFVERLYTVIREDKMKDYLTFLRQLPIVSDYQLISYVSLIKYICTDEIAQGINFYRMLDPKHLKDSQRRKIRQADYEKRESRYSDLSLRKIVQAVKSADKAAMDKALKTYGSTNDNALSYDGLMQRKYEFVMNLKEASKAAIDAGCESKYIIELFENHCRSMDSMTGISEIESHYRHCLTDLCEKVAMVKTYHDCSPNTKKAIQYVANHLYEPLNNTQIAKALSVNRQSLARTFQKDIGTSLREYVIDAKLQEALRLLKEEKMGSTDISIILFFSSQSHFIELFKRKYKATPGQYLKAGK